MWISLFTVASIVSEIVQCLLVSLFLLGYVNCETLSDAYLVHAKLFNSSACLGEIHKGKKMFEFLLYVSVLLQWHLKFCSWIFICKSQAALSVFSELHVYKITLIERHRREAGPQIWRAVWCLEWNGERPGRLQCC